MAGDISPVAVDGACNKIKAICFVSKIAGELFNYAEGQCVWNGKDNQSWYLFLVLEIS